MKAGVIVFPGSNCDHDAWYAINQNLHGRAEFIWHDSTDLSGFDAVILPGGFSYGDYLRCGAIARFSPVMNAVKKFAADGGIVLGVCNGFQILVEAGLLPGALLRNIDLRFICREVTLRTETTDSPFTSKLRKGQLLHMPIAYQMKRLMLRVHRCLIVDGPIFKVKHRLRGDPVAMHKLHAVPGSYYLSALRT